MLCATCGSACKKEQSIELKQLYYPANGLWEIHIVFKTLSRNYGVINMRLVYSEFMNFRYYMDIRPWHYVNASIFAIIKETIIVAINVVRAAIQNFLIHEVFWK